MTAPYDLALSVTLNDKCHDEEFLRTYNQDSFYFSNQALTCMR